MIEGLFCRVYFPSGDFSNCLEFKKNNTFEYELSGDLGTQSYGQGQYELSMDQLILNYDKTIPLKMSYHVSEIWQSNKDSIDVYFRFFDFNNMSIPFVNVMYNVNLTNNTSTYNGVVADKQGIAKLILSKENKEFQLIISNVGYNEYRFVLDKNYNYNISVFLQNQGNGLPIRNQIDTLQIEKIKPKYFTVKNKNGSVTKWQKIEE